MKKNIFLIKVLPVLLTLAIMNYAMPMSASATTIVDSIEITGVTKPVAGENADWDFDLLTNGCHILATSTGEECSWVGTDVKPVSFYDVIANNPKQIYQYDDPNYTFEVGYYSFILVIELDENYAFDENVTVTVDGKKAHPEVWIDNTLMVIMSFDFNYSGKRGDANLDRVVDAKDSTAISKYSAALSSISPNDDSPVLHEINDELAKNVSDVNDDDIIDAKDAAFVAKFSSMSSADPDANFYLLWNKILGWW